MTKKSSTVILDLDNTITDFQQTLNNMAEILGVEPVRTEDITDYDFMMKYDMTEAGDRIFWRVFEPTLIRNAVLAENRYNYIKNHIIPKNSKIIIVTARPENLKYDTERWLANNSVEYDELHLIGHGANKLLYILKELKIIPDMIIEDKPSIFTEVLDLRRFQCYLPNIITVCIDYEYNKNTPCEIRLDRDTGELIKRETVK